MNLILILLALIAFIILATTKFRLHPFLVLIIAAFLGGFFYALPAGEITKTITSGFGGVLGRIGPVIALGTIIGVTLERSGAMITIADTIIKAFGTRFPTLTMSIIGYIVSIPVFCDSAFCILNSLKDTLTNRLNTSRVAMSVALATGLYATHTLVPPTPGPIAAAGTLGLESNLGLVIGVGIFVAAAAALAGMFWSNRFLKVRPDENERSDGEEHTAKVLNTSYRQRPAPVRAFAPIFVPVVLICFASIARLPGRPCGEGIAFDLLTFLGGPLVALLIGLCFSVFLIEGKNKTEALSEYVGEGIIQAAPILLITGAGGAFGAILKATPLGTYLGSVLTTLGVGIFLPFIIAAALKCAQGSSTVALITTSTLVAPLLHSLGLDSQMGRVLAVMAVGAGAMTVSHANDSFFWVVSRFSRMQVGLAYRAFSMATLVQGITAMFVVYLFSLVLL